MIKLFATDMDGTFLRDDKTYDKERFLKIFQQMEQRGIFFATASGNIYQKLQEYFSEVAERMCFVADNGATVYIGKEKIFQSKMTMEKVDIITKTMLNSPLLRNQRILLCCADRSYMLSGADDEFYHIMQRFITDIHRVDSFSGLETPPVIKVSMNIPHENTAEVEEMLNKIDGIVATTSGFDAIDVMNDKISKASGLKILADELGLKENEIATFGDNRNDLSMTLAAKYSYAMGNAVPIMKQAAYATIGTNEEQAVLSTIEQLLQEG